MHYGLGWGKIGVMKKWVFVFTFVLLIFAGIFYWKISAPKPISPDKVLSAAETPSPTPPIWKQSIVIDFNDTPIRISWAVVQPKDVELYSNLKDQHLSEQIKVDKSCSVLVSGGFYSKENTHLGLFISNSEELSKEIQNPTLNGYLSIDSEDKIKIGSDIMNNSRIGLQSGPILILDRKPQLLTINNDEASRRIIVAITNNNELFFLAIYRDESEYQGPLLGDLPGIVDLFAKKNNIDIVDAINLDGGIHSIFASQYDRLVELERVGSYFCVR